MYTIVLALRVSEGKRAEDLPSEGFNCSHGVSGPLTNLDARAHAADYDGIDDLLENVFCIYAVAVAAD